MRTSVTVATVAASLLSIGLVQTSGTPGEQNDPSTSPVEPAISPAELEVTAGLPCLPPPPLNVSLTNTSGDAVVADSFLRADEPLELSRPMLSSYLPAGRDVTVPLVVTAPHGTEPGDYGVTTEVRRRLPRGTTAEARIEVVAPPPKTPGSNLLRGEQATPSSTYVTASTEFNPCGAVDGDRTWSHATGWNSANRGQFPDTYEVTLPEPQLMNRIDLYTSKSASSSPETHGLRDWDVQVMSGGSWRTVAEVRGNEQWLASSEFEPVETTAVRIVALASNDGRYSRIAELEAYYDGPVDIDLEADPAFVFAAGDTVEARAVLSNITDDPRAGVLTLQAPEGWSVDPAGTEYALDPGEQVEVPFTVTSAATAGPGEKYEIVARLDDEGKEAALELPVREGILYTGDGAPWYVETGRWSMSGLPSHGSGSTRYSPSVEGGSGATATWTPQLSRAGRYRVHVWFPANSTTTTAARYTVAHAGGQDDIVVDQRANPDRWVELGTWDFAAGQDGSVTLSSAADGHHRADAVRFEWLSR